MKTGLNLYRKYRHVIALINLLRFSIKKHLLGFEFANLFIQRVDKVSLQLILFRNGALIGLDCNIETGMIFHNCKDYSNLKIGNNCHIGKNCFFDLRDKISIGNNVVISMQCTFITHIDLSKSQLSETYKTKSDAIFIKDNCYFGAHAIVLNGVTIHERVLVASGSLVIKNIDANSVVGGVPAKLIKKIIP